jgi:glycosyltransferase involved in cell wall biosynthesis
MNRTSTTRPLVSIIIPTWNNGKELISCLKSLEEQSYRPFNVTVVDDASTDDTAARLAKVHVSFPLTVISQIERRGAAAARNAGAKLATGDFLLFVDSDEILRPHAIDRMMIELDRHPDGAFAYPAHRFGWKLFRGRPFDINALRKGPYIHTTALMRKSVFPGFDETLKKFQDWDLWLTIAERGGNGVWISEELFTIKTKKSTMSNWLPSIVYRLPWPMLGWTPRELLKYRQWEKIIKVKHHIST